MKYIVGLSLSTMALAAFLFIVQEKGAGHGLSMGEILIKSEPAIPEVRKETKKLPGSKDRAMAASAKARVTPKGAKKDVSGKTERIKNILKNRPWSEAKPEVIKILREGVSSVRPSPVAKGRDEVLPGDDAGRKDHDHEDDDDDDD